MAKKKDQTETATTADAGTDITPPEKIPNKGTKDRTIYELRQELAKKEEKLQICISGFNARTRRICELEAQLGETAKVAESRIDEVRGKERDIKNAQNSLYAIEVAAKNARMALEDF